jgi:hypothetical protein
LAYGSGYQPTSPYEKIIKIFRRGEIKNNPKIDDSWQKIAEDVGLSVSTTHTIYYSAYEFVYLKSPKKRRYGTKEDITIPESLEDIPANPGPSLEGKLTSVDEIDFYRNLFAELEEDRSMKCFKCDEIVPLSSGRELLRDQYVKLSKYQDLPDYPSDGVFFCTACLLEIVSHPSSA